MIAQKKHEGLFHTICHRTAQWSPVDITSNSASHVFMTELQGCSIVQRVAENAHLGQVEAPFKPAEKLIAQTGVEARLIFCTLRHFLETESLETAKLVHRFAGSRAVALDLAADEAGFPIQPRVAAYQFAVDHGIHRTAHAGEALGPSSVWETLRLLKPSRVGHACGA